MFEAAARLIDPTSLAIVLGGSIVAAALRSTAGDMRRALGSLRRLRASPEAEALAARRAVRSIEKIAELKGISCADHVEADCPFVRRAALKLVDAPTATAFSDWAEEELAARSARHVSASAVWRAAADAAPSMGMIGTVIGLIGMFAAMDDPASMGPAMALAMLTTFYGLVLGTLLFGPVAARLERLSAAELAWQGRTLVRLEKLARAEAETTGAWLKRRTRTPE